MAGVDSSTTTMQVELTYKAEPTITMTCITRVKSAQVCKELDDDSGIEFGEVDLRICLEAILIASPELKKEEWSVYVLDQSASERKFSGNGTITSVLKDEEPVPIVGKVKKKFRKEMLDIELRLVKVPISPAKKQPTLSLEQLLGSALQQHSLHPIQPASSPVLPQRSSPVLPTRRFLAPILQQNTPPASSSFPPFTDPLWTDFDLPQDFSAVFQDHAQQSADLPLQWDPQHPGFDSHLPPQSIDTPPIPRPQTPFAPIPPPPPPGEPSPPPVEVKSRKRSMSSKDGKGKRVKKPRKEIVMQSSPPRGAMKNLSPEDLETMFQSDGATPGMPPDYPFHGSSWEDFLVASDSEQAPPPPQQQQQQQPQPQQTQPPTVVTTLPSVAFTAVNSTTESSMEFTARQILLNAEFTPASSPDEQTQSPSGQTESDSASPAGLTPFADTPAAPPTDPTTQLPPRISERQVMADVTMQSTNEMLEPEKPKKKRGRPKGWRKVPNTEKPSLPLGVTDSLSAGKGEVSDLGDKVKKRRKHLSSATREEDQWSVRIRSSIEKELQESIAKGELPPMCHCCGTIKPSSWRFAEHEGKAQRFCNACGLYFKKWGTLRPVPTSPPKPSNPRRSKKPKHQATTTTTPITPVVEPETGVQLSSPPQREYEPMSEIDHPLLSEGIYLPRMGYLRGDNVYQSCEDEEEEDAGKENVEPDDEMEQFFSDVLA